MFATLNSIRSGFALEYSHVIDPTEVPTAFTTGLRYSRLYVPVLSSLTESSVSWSEPFSRSITTSPESPLPENSAVVGVARIVR